MLRGNPFLEIAYEKVELVCKKRAFQEVYG